jgi:malate synthase
MMTRAIKSGIDITGPRVDRQDEILTPEALGFLAELHMRFAGRRADLLADRQQRRHQIAAGADLGFLSATAAVRDDLSWHVAEPAPGLLDRRVEITGPTDRKMTINALNSGAKVWLADLEDANTPHFENVIGGQVNLYDAIRQQIEFVSATGKRYALGADTATIVMRPRGWHLTEKHLRVDQNLMPGALVDFGLYFFHNAHELIARGRGPYFYLPKLETHEEARLWNDVFVFAQDALGLPHGTIRATALIETITAAFEMEEILYELRDHSAGLNAGRWDYIFSLIKNFRSRGPGFVLPDRSDVTMTVPFMRAYTELLVRTCHKRGAHAIGGMAAAIPSKDPAANQAAFEKVRQDKRREAADGFDGSWCAHPGLVTSVREVFDDVLGDSPHQISRMRDDVTVAATDLLDLQSTPGNVTEGGLRTNVAVALRYLESWLGGLGAVAIFGLMEDAATAEISRSQIWQWIENETPLPSGEVVSRDLVAQIVADETKRLLEEIGDDRERGDRVSVARELFEDVALGRDYPTFLTIPAYARYVP